MGNTVLEDEEKKRGKQSICTVIDQLTGALSVVGAKAEKEKAKVDIARNSAEVRYSGALPVLYQKVDISGEPYVLNYRS